MVMKYGEIPGVYEALGFSMLVKCLCDRWDCEDVIGCFS